MVLKLSLSNGIFAKRPLEDNIEALKHLGFVNLEFNMKSVRENDEDSVYIAKKLIDSNGLNCLTVHAATLHVEKTEEIVRAKYYSRVSLDFAHKLNAGVLVVHSNVSRRLPEEQRRSIQAEVFGEMPSHARKLGVKLALENLSYSSIGFGKNVAELEEVFGIIDRERAMGVTLDFCHAEATGQILHLLEKYRQQISNIHVSNRAHKPFDKETTNLKLLLKKLKEFNYSGPLTIELNEKCNAEEILRTKKVIEEAIAYDLG